MTTVPSMRTVSSISLIASTAAWSAASLSPSPTQREAASAPDSVTRTSSSAWLRSGSVSVSFAIAATPQLISENARRLARANRLRLADEAADRDQYRPDHRDEVARFERDCDRAAAPGAPEDD